MSRSLLSLPVEVLCTILSLLDFGDVVSISCACSDLRKLALEECQLWQDLPVVVVSKLRALAPFVSRAGKLGANLSVYDIKPFELASLSLALGRLLPLVCGLRLKFCRTDMEDSDGLMDLWFVLSEGAPLLETLELASSFRGEFMQDVPSFTFTEDRFPRLRSLEITAFSLDTVCTAFRHVTHVTTTVAALAPRSQPALTTDADPDWANFRIHDHFPSILSLRLAEIELEDDDEFADVLTSVPYVDQPLDELLLDWKPQRVDPSAPNDASIKWIQESMKHVRVMTVVHLEWWHIRNVVFASLACGGRLSIRIERCHRDGFVWMTLSSDDLAIQRAAVLPEEDISSHLDKVLALPHVTVAAVCVPADLKDLQSLGYLWQSLHNATLGIIIYGAFSGVTGLPNLGGVTTLCLEAGCGHIAVDVRDVARLVEGIMPHVTTISVSTAATITNVTALPPSVRLVHGL